MPEYELFYWPGLPGRGEFVRLALEAAGLSYRDVAKEDETGDALDAVLEGGDRPSFAVPVLKAGALAIGQTANILFYLGHRHGLAPSDEAGRLWVNQLQLTIADWLVEVHDTHHPIASGLYYEDQKPEALRRARDFRATRLPKFLGYFERVLAASGGPYLLGADPSYADLSLFQMVEGLRYALPRAMKAAEPHHRHVVRLHGKVAALPRIKAYLASGRRIPFNEGGIFRHYPDLDG